MSSENPDERGADERQSSSRLDDAQWGRLLRALALLFVSGVSLALGVSQWASGATLVELVTKNAFPLRRGVVVGASALMGGLALYAIEWVRRGGEPALERVERGSWIASPLAVTAFVPALFARGPWKDAELLYFAVVLCVVLVFERLLRRSIPLWPDGLRGAFAFVDRVPKRVSRLLPLCVVLIAAAYYFTLVSRYTVVSHLRMVTMSSDLAEFDNLFFNALHGHPFRSPAIEGELTDWSALKVHAEFGLYMLLPFYALRPGPETLLVLQTAIVALTSVPVYLFARRRLGAAAGVVFAVAYLLFPAVQRPNFYDYHFTPFGMLLVAWLIYAVDVYVSQEKPLLRHKVGLGVAFALSLLAREDISIGVCVLGVFVALSGANVRLGVLMAVVAAAYFGIVKFGVMPIFGKMWFDTIYEDIKAPGAKGFGAALLTLVTNPVFVLRTLFTEPKFLYAMHMTVPLAALWLRRPALFVAVVPGFFSTLLVTNRPPMVMSSFQYTYLWVPYVVAASILSVSLMAKGVSELAARARRAAAVCALALAALACSFQYGALLGADGILGGFYERKFEANEHELKRLEQLRKIAALIPADASVAATEFEGPHVSTRLVMYSLKFTLGKDPDYILLGQVRPGSERVHLGQALQSGNYGVVAREGMFWLLKRGADPSKNKLLERRLPPG